jgi:hypothetical protein
MVELHQLLTQWIHLSVDFGEARERTELLIRRARRVKRYLQLSPLEWVDPPLTVDEQTILPVVAEGPPGWSCFRALMGEVEELMRQMLLSGTLLSIPVPPPNLVGG